MIIISTAITSLSRLRSGATALKSWLDNRLQPRDDIDYLLVSIYRIEFKQGRRTTDATIMKKIINFIQDGKDIKSVIKPITRFSTVLNNRILGLQVENASVYGSKIEFSMDDFDLKLSEDIRKNDVIIIHRINEKKVKYLDMLASMIGLNTYSPSGVREIGTGIGEAFNSKLLNPSSKINQFADRLLAKEVPIFSGLITYPRLVNSASTQLRIEAQDMIRILQHINTETRKPTTISGIPKNIDNAFINLDPSKEFDLKGKDNINQLESNLLRDLAFSVISRIRSEDKKIVFLKRSETIDQMKSKKTDLNKIYIYPLSNAIWLVHVSPLKALQLYLEYYLSASGMGSFWKYNIWQTNFLQNKDTIYNIFKKINIKNTGFRPFFTFGMILVDYGVEKESLLADKIEDEAWLREFVTRERSDMRGTFTNTTIDSLFKYRVTEVIATKARNNKLDQDKDGLQHLISEMFMGIIGMKRLPTSQQNSINFEYEKNGVSGNVYATGHDDIFRINNKCRIHYMNELNHIQTIFNRTMSLGYILNSNFSNLRSAKYNPLIKNQNKSIPIPQLVQLLVGAMNTIPISQSTELTGHTNAAYNISQRIWLQSAIGFSNKTRRTEKFIYNEGDKNLQATIYLSLKYSEAKDEGNTVLLREITDFDFYALPSNGSMTIYSDDAPNIKIGIVSRYDSEKKPYSMGSIVSYDLSTIVTQKHIDAYLVENVSPQIGGVNLSKGKSIPRICEFRIDSVDETPRTVSQIISELYDPFNLMTDIATSGKRLIYMGYDLDSFGGAEDESINIKLTKDFRILCPMVSSDSNKTIVHKLATTGQDGLFKIYSSTEQHLKIENNNQGRAKIFPQQGKAMFGTTIENRRLITGVRTYYDISQFRSVFDMLKNYINYGFVGSNGGGDKNIYTDKDLFSIYLNFEINPEKVYFEELPDGKLKKFGLRTIVNNVLKWLKVFGTKANKEYIILKFAKKITSIKFNAFGIDDDITKKPDNCPIKQFVGNTTITTVALQHFVAQLGASELTLGDAERTVKGLLSIVNCVSHFMNITSKESTVGGVIFMPLSQNSEGNLPQIGDKINFTKDIEAISGGFITGAIKQLGRGLVDAVLRPLDSSELSIFKKDFYIWKIVYYFGGAGTNPSGTSGSTMRVYLTDSGIHWGSSHEENDITTQIAERLRIQGLPNKLG